MDINVYWSDGFSVHAAPLSKQGVARIDGLDGDYNVTLSAVPNEYAYNPNDCIATNENRGVVIELFPIIQISGAGTGIYSCHRINQVGVYSAKITEKCEKGSDSGGGIFFEFAPPESGTYTIESWVDVTADKINPYVDVYGGNSQFKYYVKTTDDGGAIGSYTINFIHTVEIADEHFSSSGGGQATYTFAVKAQSKNDRYPISVTFAIKRNGGFNIEQTWEKSTAIPEFDFSTFNKADHEYSDSEYKLSTPEYLLPGTSAYVFDDRLFKLGDDGFYHLYDEEKYAQTDGWGPIIYAHITSACRFLDACTQIEYRNGETINSALTVGGVNYKHFIEGYTALSTYGAVSKNGGSYYCNADCPCHTYDANDESTWRGWACTEACNEPGCADCRKIPVELVGFEGYQAYANSDGLVPVTEELKTFLNRFSKANQYFYDGEGWIENNNLGIRIDAYPDSEWLFACAYYEPIE